MRVLCAREGIGNRNHKQLTLYSLKAFFIYYSPDTDNSENKSDCLVTSEVKTTDIGSA